MIKKILLTSLFLFAVVNAQSISNLQVLYGLLDSSANSVKSKISGNAFLLLNNNSGFAMFNSKIAEEFEGYNKQAADTLNYNIVSIKFKYSEPFRKSFLSSIYTVREAELTTVYSFKNTHKEIKTSFSDTIKAGEIPELEKDPFPFTKGELPQEGAFDSLFEPVIALTASAAAVILFFIVRSK